MGMIKDKILDLQEGLTGLGISQEIVRARAELSLEDSQEALRGFDYAVRILEQALLMEEGEILGQTTIETVRHTKF